MKLTLNNKIFLGIILILLLINLFIANDAAIIWSGPEAWRIWQLDYSTDQLFLLRLPGPIFMILGMTLFWLLGRKIFGERSSLFAVVILGTSLLVPNLAKQAILDTWVLTFQIGSLLGLLLYLKQPKLQWQLLFYTSLLPSLWLAPLNSLLTFGLMSTAFYFLHPQGKRLWKLMPWLAIALIFGGLYLSGQLHWATDGFFIAYLSKAFYKNLAFQLLAFLPFMGFVISGLWELVQKVKKKEEFSIILLCWVFAAIAGQSLLFSVALALLVAKQMDAYFVKHYPYRSMVKTGFILHLLLAFFGICFLMMRGFYEFKGMGFRAALAFGALYWMPALIAVIGLYGRNRRFVLGGTIFSAAMATLFFWVQLYPLLYTRLNWPEVAVQDILATAKTQNQIWIYKAEGTAFPALACYARHSFSEVEIIESEEAIQNALKNIDYRPLIVPWAAIENDSIANSIILLDAWGSNGLRPQKYQVLLKSLGK